MDPDQYKDRYNVPSSDGKQGILKRVANQLPSLLANSIWVLCLCNFAAGTGALIFPSTSDHVLVVISH